MKKIFSLILLLVFSISCSSTTTVISSDKDTKIFIDGELKGRGTVTFTNTKITGSTTKVKISKKNCQDQNFEIIRNEEVDVGAVLAGVLIVPLLWTMKYKAAHPYIHVCN